jgi:hypothetical protein
MNPLEVINHLFKPMKLTQKQAIVQSLDSMNHTETDQLIQYIRDLLYNPQNDMDYLRKRSRGMSQIREALHGSIAF